MDHRDNLLMVCAFVLSTLVTVVLFAAFAVWVFDALHAPALELLGRLYELPAATSTAIEAEAATRARAGQPGTTDHVSPGARAPAGS